MSQINAMGNATDDHKKYRTRTRTAANSAGHLLSFIKPDMKILDVGCGPGTITVDFAELVPQGQVIGVEKVSDVLEEARGLAATRGLKNIHFEVGDALALDYPDHTFDIVHAHQVIQHVTDPVQAFREMRRVTKKDGIVAVRETDFSSAVIYPEYKGVKEWNPLYVQLARSRGGEPDAGRQLHAWARQAGFNRSDITTTAGTVCYSTDEERATLCKTWAGSTLTWWNKDAVSGGYATESDLERIAQAWRDWAANQDGWAVQMYGAILCRV